jgi:excisionase family DNA binding protein
MPTDDDRQLEPMLTVRDLAVLLNVPPSWVYANSYQLPTHRVGRGLRFRRSDVEAWLAGHRQDTASSTGGGPGSAYNGLAGLASRDR